MNISFTGFDHSKKSYVRKLKCLVSIIFPSDHNARILHRTVYFGDCRWLVAGRIGDMEKVSPEFVVPSPAKDWRHQLFWDYEA